MSPCIFLLKASFSASFCSILLLYSVSSWNAFDCWALESLTFYWAFLTYSANPEFYWSNFCIFFFSASLSWSLVVILSLYSLSYLIIFWFCCADSLRFSCADLIYPYRPLFSPSNFCILYCRFCIVVPIALIYWIWFFNFPISLFLFSMTEFNLSIYWDNKANVSSSSITFLLISTDTFNCFFNSSFSLHTAFN